MPEPFPKIDVWSFDLDNFVKSSPRHPEDAACAEKIADPVRRLRFERGRIALRGALGFSLGISATDVIFEIASGGKPRVPGCEFSLSHSGPWQVVAIGQVPVGVDIEAHRPRKDPLALAERFFSVRDLEALREVDDSQRDAAFIRQWVAKEAALKCEGVGLSEHLLKVECSMDGKCVTHVTWDARRFSICEFALPDGTPGAVATFGDGKAELNSRDISQLGLS